LQPDLFLRRNGGNPIAMTKKECLGPATELATRCRLFADKICRDWNEECSGDEPIWTDVDEMRELYDSVLTLRHAADKALQRVKLFK
jgi:hypothetical protein